VKKRETWELHRLWLGDIPAGLRQAVGFLRFRSLEPAVAFTASIDDLIAAALLARLDRRFRVPIGVTLTDVPAIIDLPESPGERTPPYILIIPWSVQVIGQRGGSGEVIDNHTATGAIVRPSPREMQLEYCVDVFAQVRSQKALLMEQRLRSSSQLLQGGQIPRGASETELALMPFPFQATTSDQAAGEMMPLRPLGACPTARQTELLLAHFNHCLDWGADAIKPP
jgi:hypothetical protein